MRHASYICLTLCITSSMAFGAASEAGTKDAIQNSVVRLSVVYAGGKSGSGTGFFINNNCQIATAYHVVQDAVSIQALKYEGNFENGQGGWAIQGPRVDPSRIIIEGYSPRLDLALISFRDITSCRALEFSDYKGNIDNAFSADILTPVAQLGLKRLTVENFARKIQTLDDLLPGRTVFSDNVLDVLVHVLSGEIVNGMSGSPVIVDGKVLGIVSGSREQGGDFGWAIPIEYLNEIDQIGESLNRIRTWPQLTLLHKRANQKLRLSARRPTANSARLLYSPVVFGVEAAVEVQTGNATIDALQIGPKEVKGPIGVATNFLLPVENYGVTRFPYRAVLSDGVIKQGSLKLLSVDPGLMGMRADEWRARAVGVAARHGDLSTALNFLNATTDPKWLAEAHANFCWELITDDRLSDCLDLVAAIEMHSVTDDVITKLVGWALFQRKWHNRITLASQITKLARRNETRDELLRDIAKAAEEREISRDAQVASDSAEAIEQEKIASATKLDLAKKNFWEGNLSKSLDFALNAFTSNSRNIQSKIDLLIGLTDGLAKSQRREKARQAAVAAYETIVGAYAPHSPERLHYLIRLANPLERHGFENAMLQVVNEFDRYASRKPPVVLEQREIFEQTIVSMMSFWSHKSQTDQAIDLFELLETPKYRLFGLTISALSAVKSLSSASADRFVDLIIKERDAHTADRGRQRIGNFYTVASKFVTAGDSSHSWHFSWLGPDHSQYDLAKLDLFVDWSIDPFEIALGSIAVEQWFIGDIEGAIKTLSNTGFEINSTQFMDNAFRRLDSAQMKDNLSRREVRRAVELIGMSQEVELQFSYLRRLKEKVSSIERSLIDRKLTSLSAAIIDFAKNNTDYIERHIRILSSAVDHASDTNGLRAVLELLRGQLDPELLTKNRSRVDAKNIVSSYSILLNLCQKEKLASTCTDEDFDALVSIANNEEVKYYFSGAIVASEYLFRKERFGEIANIIMLDYDDNGGFIVNTVSDRLIRELRFRDLESLREALSALALKPGPSNAKAMTDRIDMRMANLPDQLSRDERLNLVAGLMPSQAKDMLLIKLAKDAERFGVAISLTSKVENADILRDEITKALEINARLNHEDAINYVSDLESKDDNLSFLVLAALLDSVDSGSPEILKQEQK